MSAELVNPPPVGYFGKMPSRGDFVQRGLPAVFVERWDDWLQRVLAEARAARGEQWLDAYLTAPIWRFSLGAGVIDDHAWYGAIMPSVDRVNRYFPLTVAARGARQASAMNQVRGNLHWYRAIEDLLIDALDDDTRDVEAFHDALSAVPSAAEATSADDVAAAADAAVEVGAYGMRVVVPDTDVGWNDRALDRMLAHLLHDRLGDFSVFWRAAAGSDGELRVTAGLPDAASCSNWLFGT